MSTQGNPRAIHARLSALGVAVMAVVALADPSWSAVTSVAGRTQGGTNPLERLDAARALAADAASRLDAAQDERAGLELEITSAEQEVGTLRARADELRVRVRRRAVRLYVRVAPRFLDAVVDTHNVVDAARAAHLTTAAGDRDESAVAELEATLRVLADRRAQLRARHAELDELIASLTQLRADLEDRVARAVTAYRQTVRESAGETPGPRAPAADDAGWLTFRECTFAHESGGNYQIVSSDGLYYGAWQFAIGTWNAVAARMGRADLVGVLPSQASPDDQDAVAHVLWLDSGNRPWGGRC